MGRQDVHETMECLEAILTVSRDGIVIVNHDGIILRVNPAFTMILGYEEHEIRGKPFYILAYKSHKMQQITSHNSLHRFYCSEHTGMEMTLFDKQGQNIPVRFRSAFIRDKQGQIKQAVGIIEHMVELPETGKGESRLAEKMWEAQQNFENILNSSVDAIVMCDISGNIMMANQAFSRMLDYSQEEVMGKHIVEFTAFEEGIYLTSTGEKVIIDKPYVSHTASKCSELFEKGYVSNWEPYLLKKNRVHVPAEITMSVLKDMDGERRGSLVIVRDISRRKKAERMIREAKEFMENVFRTSADGIIITDDQGSITMVNASAERMLGCVKDDLVGKSTSVLSPEGNQYQDRSRKYLEELFEKGSVRAFEFAWLKKDGRLFDVEVNTALLKDSENNIAGSVTSIRDITERKHHQEALQTAYDEMEMRVRERTADLKRSNEQLIQEIQERERAEKKLFEAKEVAEYANKAKSEFLANMSHELRTPLNHIIGFTELVVGKHFGDLSGTQEEYLHDVLYSSKHLLSLINDILDLSKVEAGKMHLEPSSINVQLLLDQSLIMFKEKTFKHGIELSTDLRHIPETITADERKLKQIIYNLLSNAVKFTPDGGKVCLQARVVDCIVRHGQRWGDPKGLQIIAEQRGPGNTKNTGCEKCIEIAVSDTGIGIKWEDLGRIFKPFEQADGSPSRRYQGTGLGLSLTKKLVELHGGKIWVESAGEGKGSTFTFTIPV